jgi:hypothetical protein
MRRRRPPLTPEQLAEIRAAAHAPTPAHFEGNTMPTDPAAPRSAAWTAEERAELRKFLARYDIRPGEDISIRAHLDRLERLAQEIEASGPPPRDDPAMLDLVERMGRAARRWVDELERGAALPHDGEETPADGERAGRASARSTRKRGV